MYFPTSNFLLPLASLSLIVCTVCLCRHCTGRVDICKGSCLPSEDMYVETVTITVGQTAEGHLRWTCILRDSPLAKHEFNYKKSLWWGTVERKKRKRAHSHVTRP